ncbi:hypothetical protein LXL04_036081 [Taraxacum kok-saghyz]
MANASYRERKSGSFEYSYIPENQRSPKPLTFSKNRLREAKNRSNTSPVAKKNFRKNDFFFQKLCICAHFFVLSLYNTYLKGFVKNKFKKKRKKKSCTYAKIKKKIVFSEIFFCGRACILAIFSSQVVIDSIHGPDPLFTRSDRKNCNSKWIRIIKCTKNLDQFELDPRKIIRKRCENGRNTQFWEDSWLLEKPLREVYPRLYNLEINKNCLVADRSGRGDPISGVGEREKSLKIWRKKCGHSNARTKRTGGLLMKKKQDRFSTAWFRETLYKKEEHQPSTKNLWLNWIPKKRILFAWRALKGRIPVRVVLDKMEVDIPDINCCISKNISESVLHVLMFCEWAKKVWQGIGNWWDIDLSGCSSIQDLFDYIDKRNFTSTRKKMLYSVIIATLNIIWEHRNGVCFEEKEMREANAIIKIKEEFPMDYLCIRVSKVITYRSPTEALWVKILTSIHGDKGGLNGEIKTKIQGSIWLNIINSFNSLNNANLNPSSLISIRIGNGVNTCFWTDRWYNGDTLATRFPRLFALEDNKAAKVAERAGLEVEDWQRRRQVRGGREQEELEMLKDLMGNISLSNEVDGWTIPSTPGERFSSRWLRGIYATQRYSQTASTNRWNKGVPKKRRLFYGGR